MSGSVREDTDTREISLNLGPASTSLLINLDHVDGANGHHEEDSPGGIPGTTHESTDNMGLFHTKHTHSKQSSNVTAIASLAAFFDL